MSRYAWGVMLLPMILGACEDGSYLEEYLEVGLLDDTAQVDTVCDNGGCEEPAQLSFSLSLDYDNALPENDEVELLQYKVEYTAAGLSGKIPPFAGPAQIIARNGSSVPITLQVAGTQQREFVYNHIGGRKMRGTATLTLAGYDEKNERVDAEFGFSIRFGDYVTNSPTPSGEE